MYLIIFIVTLSLWYSGINWNKLKRKEYAVIFVPDTEKSDGKKLRFILKKRNVFGKGNN